MKTACLQKGAVTLAASVECAETVWERMKGLLGRDGLGACRAMFLSPCSSIHTFSMRFSLDLIFLSREMVVCRVVQCVNPNRIVVGGIKAWGVVEMEAGWFPFDSVKPGDELRLTEATPGPVRHPR